MNLKFLDYMNIAQLKALHKKEVETLKAMRESRTLPRIHIQLFSQQHAFAISQQQSYVNAIADKIHILESLTSSKFQK